MWWLLVLIICVSAVAYYHQSLHQDKQSQYTYQCISENPLPCDHLTRTIYNYQ